MSASLFSVLSQLARVVSGPLVLLVITSSLDSEVMGFYFTFINIIALQQILEMGFGFTIVQFISHAQTKGGGEKHTVQANSYRYYLLSKVWFLIIAICVAVFINLGGVWFYSGYQGGVAWLYPWQLLIVSVSINCFLMPCQILLEGAQQQVVVYRARFFSAIVGSVMLLICIFYNLGLYSLSIAGIGSSMVLYLLLKPHYKLFTNDVSWQVSCETNKVNLLKNTITEVWPMLSKISVTWILGYFFWNSFNLISFKLMTPSFAGKLGLSLAMAKAGYSIAESLLTAKISLFSNLIAQKKSSVALSVFQRNFYAAMTVLIAGYIVFLLFYTTGMFPFINKKVLDVENLVSIFMYFTILLPITLHANYCRAFKHEPYFYLSLFMNLCVPIVFIVSCMYFPVNIFAPLCIVNLISLYWSTLIFKRQNRIVI